MFPPAVQWRKEVRALLPWWSATVVAMVACLALMRPDALPTDLVYSWAVQLDRDFLLGVGLCAYALGAVLLGALSLGQEYAHHTLPTLLTQPIPRGRQLLMKLSVLTAMLAALGALAFGAWGADPALTANFDDARILRFGLLPLGCGLFLAPWLSMAGRSPLAGAVFTFALPSFLWASVDALRLPVALFWLSTVAFGAVGAVMTWRTFLRLEATGGSHTNVDLTSWFSHATRHAGAARVQSREWLLVKKELRLQQATFVVSGLYVAACVAVVVIHGFVPDAFGSSPLFVATFINGGLVSVMAGALASAEERRLGAAEWHTLLPFGVWRQWLIKIGVAVALTIALAIVPAMVLDAITPESVIGETTYVGLVMLCIVALYVSSISTNGVRAMLVTVPAIAVAVLIALEVLWPVARAAQPSRDWLVRTLPVVGVDHLAYAWWLRWGAWSMTVGAALLVIRWGYANHKTSDRSVGRVARQLAWLSAYAVAAMFCLGLVSQLLLKWIMVTGPD